MAAVPIVEPQKEADSLQLSYAINELERFRSSDIGFLTDSYSLSNLAYLLLHSKKGLHLVHAPTGTSESKLSPDRFPTPDSWVRFKLNQFALRAGLEHDPPLPFPLSLPFAHQDRIIQIDTLGLFMLAQTRWSQRFFQTHRSTWLGRSPQDGFVGGLFTQMALEGMNALEQQLAYDGHSFLSFSSQTYEPQEGIRYWPHHIRVERERPHLVFKAQDRSSSLGDLASLLFATSEFYVYSDPLIQDNYDRIFGDQKDFRTSGALFPESAHVLAKHLSGAILKNILALHFNESARTCVNSFSPERRGSAITTRDASLLIMALEQAYRTFHDVPELKDKALKLLKAQALFLVNQLQAPDHGFYTTYQLTLEKPDRSARSLESQGLGIQALSLAYRLTRDERFRQAAYRAYTFLRTRFWLIDEEIYVEKENDQNQTTLSLRAATSILAASREIAAIAHDPAIQDAVLKEMHIFFDNAFARQDGKGFLRAARSAIPVEEIHITDTLNASDVPTSLTFTID